MNFAFKFMQLIIMTSALRKISFFQSLCCCLAACKIRSYMRAVATTAKHLEAPY